VSAVDASADLHAADLVRAFRERRPGTRFFGAGGVALEKAGMEILVPQREFAVGGLVEVMGVVPNLLRALATLQRAARAERAGLAVLVDGSGFHLPLARRLRRAGVPVLYFIGPNVLRWRRWRMKKLSRRVDRLASIFPYEADLYARTPLRVDYVGHPLVEPIEEFCRQWDRVRARASLRLEGDDPAVALFPGSRRNEIRYMLPLFLATAQRLHERNPRTRFLLGLAPSIARDEIDSAMADAGSLPIHVVEDRTRELLLAADAALAKPGTITMESALLGCPLVVAGRAHPITAALLRRMVHERSFAMPNVIAGEAVVPEFLQEEAQPEPMAEALSALLAGEARERQLAGLARVRERLGEGGAARRTAEIAEEMLGRQG
jgi:lipid-A-disaccharide synthase